MVRLQEELPWRTVHMLNTAFEPEPVWENRSEEYASKNKLLRFALRFDRQ